jgi:hypothetical protein
MDRISIVITYRGQGLKSELLTERPLTEKKQPELAGMRKTLTPLPDYP